MLRLSDGFQEDPAGDRRASSSRFVKQRMTGNIRSSNEGQKANAETNQGTTFTNMKGEMS